MRQKVCAAGAAFGAITVFCVLFLFGGALPSGAAESGPKPSPSVVVVEPGYPAEKPAEPQTDTRDVTMGDGSLPPVPVRVVRRGVSGDVTQTQQSVPVAVPVSVDAAVPSGEIPNPGLPVSYDPAAIRRPVATRTAEVGRWAPRHKAILVPDAAPLLDPGLREERLTRIAEGKFTRVLLAFSPSTLETVRTFDGTQQLYDLLKSAGEKNLTVDLLLRNSGRSGDDATSLAEFFRPFPFRAVLLSFGENTPAGEIVSSLEAAVATAGRPVGVVVAPAVLEGRGGDVVASAFYRLNLTDVVLPLYSTNAEEVAARFQAICRFYVDLPFSLMQSVDLDRPRTESYFTAGVSIFGMRMKKLCFDVAASNAQDLIVDSFEDYLRMAP